MCNFSLLLSSRIESGPRGFQIETVADDNTVAVGQTKRSDEIPKLLCNHIQNQTWNLNAID